MVQEGEAMKRFLLWILVMALIAGDIFVGIVLRILRVTRA